MKQSIYSKRTQISLSPQLKNLIKARGAVLRESLSEYLRRAAILRMALEDVDKQDLQLVAEAVIGSVPKAKGGWRRVKDVSVWQRKERENAGLHRA